MSEVLKEMQKSLSRDVNLEYKQAAVSKLLKSAAILRDAGFTDEAELVFNSVFIEKKASSELNEETLFEVEL